MGIYVDSTTAVVFYGLTGRTARADAEYCRRYGTNIVAGVVPGRAGQSVLGIPVYDCGADAREAQGGLDLAVLYVPAPKVLEAGRDALEAGVRLIQIITESVPVRDFCILWQEARERGVVINGPNSNGIITVGQAKVGIIGNVPWAFTPGRVGIVSRSGGLTHEVGWALARSGLGVSTAMSIGGDKIVGASFLDVIQEFEGDDATDGVVMVCDPGGTYEEELVRHHDGRPFEKPIVAVLLGHFLESQPRGVSYGHAGALIEGERGRPSHKRRMLEAAGVRVADDLGDLADLLDVQEVPAR